MKPNPYSLMTLLTTDTIINYHCHQVVGLLIHTYADAIKPSHTYTCMHVRVLATNSLDMRRINKDFNLGKNPKIIFKFI